MPEPMKSEMLAAVDVVEMKRLGGGKVSYSSLFSFLFLCQLEFCSDFNQEQLKVHARGECDEARRAVGD